MNDDSNHKEISPTSAHLKPFKLTSRGQYELLAEIEVQKGSLLKRPGQDLAVLSDLGLIKRKGQRLSLTKQGRIVLDAIRTVIPKLPH